MDPHSNGHPGDTRHAILQILRRRGGGVSVEELAGELDLAGATVRRHLDVLLRDDYVSVTQARGRTGRPRYLFTLTEAGEELFPHHYVRLTSRLLEEIVSLSSDETAGRSGDEIAELVFEKMSDRLAREYGPRVHGETLAERVRSAAQLVAREGIEFEVQPDEAGGVRLLGRGCPCARIGAHAGASAGGGPRACDHDRRMLERLLGAQVSVLPREQIPHDFLCGYQVEQAIEQAAEAALPARPASRAVY
jgi:DeoR family suf operon transcriptional repressor